VFEKIPESDFYVVFQHGSILLQTVVTN
jgi:hypothetical protein